MADDALVIAVSELREALDRLLGAAALELGPSIDLDADHYWWIDTREAFDVTREPSLEAGQLSDDVASTREMLHRDDDEVILWHDLDHLIGILQRIAGLAKS
jgi:hypothetical protein